MSGNGFNPLRWDCEKQGCFNQLKRPKIEVFHGCFPGNINFGDVDGLVEINGHGLLLEWKENNGSIPTGQRITHEKLTKTGMLTTIVIIGNPEHMTCQKYGFFFKGKFQNYKQGDIEKVKEVIKKWAVWAKKR